MDMEKREMKKNHENQQKSIQQYESELLKSQYEL